MPRVFYMTFGGWWLQARGDPTCSGPAKQCPTAPRS